MEPDNTMFILWRLNALLWGAVFIWMAPTVWHVLTGTTKNRHAPLRIAIASEAVMMFCFSVRWLVAPHDMILWKTIYVLSLANAVLLANIAKAYGREPK